MQTDCQGARGRAASVKSSIMKFRYSNLEVNFNPPISPPLKRCLSALIYQERRCHWHFVGCIYVLRGKTLNIEFLKKMAKGIWQDWRTLGVARKLIGNALPISARVGELRGRSGGLWLGRDPGGVGGSVKIGDWVFDLVGIFPWLRSFGLTFRLLVLREYSYLGVYLSAVTIWCMPFVLVSCC